MAVITNFGVPVEGESGATLMPKLQYRFRVQFQNLGKASGTKATRNVVSVGRPALDHDDVTVDTYNSKIRLAGKHMWQDITLVLRDDVDSEVIKLLGQQLNYQVNHADQSSSRAGMNYKFGMTIETLDGSNDDSDAAVLDRWTLAGCFIPSIQYGDLNYATSDMVQVTVTIRYDNASHDIDGTDVLSQNDTVRSGSASTTDVV
jgi:hypothetical protein